VPLSNAYLNTLAKMQTQEMEADTPLQLDHAKQQSRGYNRSSAR
jgi:hypothetical protein